MVKLGELLKVTRDDIQDFPGDTIDIILDLQREGWRATRSNRNHVMLLAPDGVTKYSASRNASSAKYLREDIARYKRGEKPLTKEEIDEMEEEEVVPTSKFPCPQKDCPKFFVSQNHLNVHIGADHEGMLVCPHANCFELFSKPQALGRHRQAKHGYVSPNKAKRKDQETRRAEKEANGTDIKVPVAADNPEEVVHDVMEVKPMTDREREFKDLPTVVIHPTDQDSEVRLNFFQHNAENPGYSASEIYRQTHAQLDAARDAVRNEQVVRTDEDIEFLDTRDSWVVDDPELMTSSVNSIRSILTAVGLEMEIRVWRKK